MELMLQQKQKLNLVMTVELRQAIALLQYSTIDLYEYLKEQELENPLIELVDREELPFNNRGKSAIKSSESASKNPIDFVASKETCEREKLMEQVNWMDIEEKEKAILHYLILNLDENGYLPLKETEISSDIGISEELVKQGIERLQHLEPVGVGARNLSECIVLQVRHYYPNEAITVQIAMHHLDRLANKKWHDIAKLLNTTLAEVKSAYDNIRSIKPKPCRLDPKPTEYLNPDIIVEENKGKFEVYLNDRYLPAIQFNNSYTNMTSKISDLHNYVKNKYKSYQMLVDSIEQRKNTILKVTHAVLNRQSGFLEHGFSALQPLTLKEIADEIDMHESTVSRATTNKVIQTPKGTFDFRLFFTSKLDTENGASTSQTKVKLLMENFIKNENKYKPYSDQKIADHFKIKKGIIVSRRTVAKYREELNIPSSNKRKEIRV